MIDQLTNHLWQSTLFAVAAGLLTVVFRKNRAQVRFWLWFSASFKFFVPFSLLLSLGGKLETWAPATKTIAPDTVSFTIVQVAQPFTGTASFVPPAHGAMHWLPLAIFGVWVCGFAAIALTLLRAWIGIRAAVRSSSHLEIPAPVEVRTSPGLLEPGVVGLLHPILLLPAGILERLTPSQLEAVIAHELCHVRRRDNLFASIHMLVEAIFWFHPLVWWIGARLVEERERACDEAVLGLGSEPRTYADAILGVCKLCVESPLACVSGVTGANLKRRIEAIMTNSPGHALNRAKKFLLAVAGVAALAGPVAVGVAIGIGHVPAVRAQTPIGVPSIVQTPQAAQPASVQRQERRLTAILFDFGVMASDEQSRARQSTIDFVHSGMKPGDVVAIMAVAGGNVAIAQDFTDDPVALESAILKLNAGDGSARVPSSIEAAAKLLAEIPGRKSLMYFPAGIAPTGTNVNDDPQLSRAVQAAVSANVALLPIGAPAPAGVQAKFGSPSSAMAQAYIRYGPPDQTDDRGSSQIWRYNYLENFHSSVEFEFTGSNPRDMRINWPPPMATYEGTPALPTTLSEALSGGGPGRGAGVGGGVGGGAGGGIGGGTQPNIIAGLPTRHASMQIYPASEFQTLSVPLDSMSGRVDIVGQIETLGAEPAKRVAAIRDAFQAGAGTYQAKFILNAGTYVCSLIVREQTTGRMYGETITFQVK